MAAGAPLSIAGLLGAALGGYTQGVGQKYQRQIAQAQMQALANYHNGLVQNGYLRANTGQINADGTNLDGSAATDAQGNPVQGKLQTGAIVAADNTQRTNNGTVKLLGTTDPATGQPVLGSMGVANGKLVLSQNLAAPKIADQPLLDAAHIAALQATADKTGVQAVTSAYGGLGTAAPGQQAGMAQAMNAQSGLNLPVPGTQTLPTLPDGSPAQGPPSIVPSYAPNAVQQATMAQKAAAAHLAGVNANTLPGFRNAQEKALSTNAGAAALRAQIYGETEPMMAGAAVQNANTNSTNAQTNIGRLGVSQGMLGVAQGNLGVNQQRVLQGAGGASTSTLAAQKQIQSNMQAAAKMQAYLGKDANGKFITADPNTRQGYANALQSLQNQNIALGRQINTPSLPPMPIRGVGSLVPVGTQTPYAPPLPGFPSNLPGANSRPAPVVRTRIGTIPISAIQAEIARRRSAR